MMFSIFFEMRPVSTYFRFFIYRKMMTSIIVKIGEVKLRSLIISMLRVLVDDFEGIFPQRCHESVALCEIGRISVVGWGKGRLRKHQSEILFCFISKMFRVVQAQYSVYSSESLCDEN
jgi:hypothetical protein